MCIYMSLKFYICGIMINSDSCSEGNALDAIPSDNYTYGDFWKILAANVLFN